MNELFSPVGSLLISKVSLHFSVIVCDANTKIFSCSFFKNLKLLHVSGSTSNIFASCLWVMIGIFLAWCVCNLLMAFMEDLRVKPLLYLLPCKLIDWPKFQPGNSLFGPCSNSSKDIFLKTRPKLSWKILYIYGKRLIKLWSTKVINWNF